jgi:hypothetical protein
LDALPESEMAHIVQFPSPSGSPAGGQRASWTTERDDLMVMAKILDDPHSKAKRSSTDGNSVSSTGTASSKRDNKKVLKGIGEVARILGVW